MTRAATRVCIYTKSKPQPKFGDKVYLCYEETTPPWDEDVFFVKDETGRNWFCHESKNQLDQDALQNLANQLKDEYTPQSNVAFQRRLNNPLLIQIVVCRAETLEELQSLLGGVKFQRHPGEAA